MPDLTVEQFFYHADVLSGQDVGKVRPHLGTKLDRLDLVDGGFVERAVAALDSTRTGDTTSIWTDLVGMFPDDAEGGIWRHWKGQAAGEAWEKFRHVRLWFHQEASDGVFRQDALLPNQGFDRKGHTWARVQGRGRDGEDHGCPHRREEARGKPGLRQDDLVSRRR